MDALDAVSEPGAASPPPDSSTGQSVKVAVNIRPLIAPEIESGCQECVVGVPGIPQVQVVSGHSFTFDHVYGGGGRSMAHIFEECVLPLVDGLFQGYNATVLAYGQTGSGKTHTMGTGFTAGVLDKGIAPRVMEALFSKVSELKQRSDFNIRVSLIEIHQEEIRDLLEANEIPSALSNGLRTLGSSFGSGRNSWPPGSVEKQPITIRELPSGVSLLGVTEQEVMNQQDMLTCLENGLLFRATGSHNMNARSSRSHAIFTIIVEQRRRWNGEAGNSRDEGVDLLCAKMHLVDLAGSERIKRTKSEGMRLKEGIHINKGLLALGNVISALGDDKLRKMKAHVPYRDSKLTRLLQDSLGGNSRTVMIACVSPADTNLEETLNTLKYANRARNIQNKPTVNRLGDSSAIEIRRLRQQIEILQAELANRGTSTAGSSDTAVETPAFVQSKIEASEELEILKQRIKFLETTNSKLRQGLAAAREAQALEAQRCAELETRNANLMTEIVLATEEARKEMHIELESGSHTTSQLWVELDRVKKECREEVERARAAETGVRSQLAALLDIAHSEAEKSRAKASDLRLALATAQEEARAEAEKVQAARESEAQLRSFLLAVQETARAESKRARVAETVIASLREEIASLREKAKKESESFWQIYSSMQKELTIARKTIEKEIQNSASAHGKEIRMAAELMAAEERARAEFQKAMEAQSLVAQVKAQMVSERDRQNIAAFEKSSKLQSQLMTAQEIALVESMKLQHEQGVNEHLKKDLAWKNDQARTATTKLATAEGEIQWLSKALQMEEENNKSKMHLTGRREDNSGKLNEMKLEITRLSFSLDAAQKTNKTLEMELAQIREQFKRETDKIYYFEEENNQLSSELSAAKEREKELERSLHAAELETKKLRGETQSVSVSANLAAERAEKFHSVGLQLREELGKVKEVSKLEGLLMDDAIARLSAMEGRVAVAEEKAREEEEKARNTAAERDYYLEVALAGKSPCLNSELVQSLVFLYPKINELAKSGQVSPSQALNFALHNIEAWQHEEIAKEVEAAILIQSMWKMYITRKHFYAMKNATKLIQARWRFIKYTNSKNKKHEKEKRVKFAVNFEDKNGPKLNGNISLKNSVVLGTSMNNHVIHPSVFVESEPKHSKSDSRDRNLEEPIWASQAWTQQNGFPGPSAKANPEESHSEKNGRFQSIVRDKRLGSEERGKENGYGGSSPVHNLLRVESSPSFKTLKNGGLDTLHLTGLLPTIKEKNTKPPEKEKTEISTIIPSSLTSGNVLSVMRKKFRDTDSTHAVKDEKASVEKGEEEKILGKSLKANFTFPPPNSLPQSLSSSSSSSASSSSLASSYANGQRLTENGSAPASVPTPPVVFAPKPRQIRPSVHAPRGDFSFRPTLDSLPESEREEDDFGNSWHTSASDSERDPVFKSRPTYSVPTLPSRSISSQYTAAKFMISEFSLLKPDALILVSGNSSRIWGSTALGLHGEGKSSSKLLMGLRSGASLSNRNWKEYCQAVHREKLAWEGYVFNGHHATDSKKTH